MLARYQATCNRGELPSPPLPEDTNHHGLTPLPPLPDEVNHGELSPPSQPIDDDDLVTTVEASAVVWLLKL